MNFQIFASKVSELAGHPSTFSIAISVVALWLLSGPIFGFSDTWQLLINTTSTISTGLMVFIIQNSQNRETRAIQTKLDGLIKSLDRASDDMIDLEHKTDSEILEMKHKLVSETDN